MWSEASTGQGRSRRPGGIFCWWAHHQGVISDSGPPFRRHLGGMPSSSTLSCARDEERPKYPRLVDLSAPLKWPEFNQLRKETLALLPAQERLLTVAYGEAVLLDDVNLGPCAVALTEHRLIVAEAIGAFRRHLGRILIDAPRDEIRTSWGWTRGRYLAGPYRTINFEQAGQRVSIAFALLWSAEMKVIRRAL